MSGGHSSSRCVGPSLSRPLLLRSTGSRCAGSVVVAHGPSCSVTCGILPDQGSNPCALHWQADSQPLRHQGSPFPSVLKKVIELYVSHEQLPRNMRLCYLEERIYFILCSIQPLIEVLIFEILFSLLGVEATSY